MSYRTTLSVFSANTPAPQLLQAVALPNGAQSDRNVPASQGTVVPLTVLKPGGVTANSMGKGDNGDKNSGTHLSLVVNMMEHPSEAPPRMAYKAYKRRQAQSGGFYPL